MKNIELMENTDTAIIIKEVRNMNESNKKKWINKNKLKFSFIDGRYANTYWDSMPPAFYITNMSEKEKIFDDIIGNYSWYGCLDLSNYFLISKDFMKRSDFYKLKKKLKGDLK